MLVLIFFGSILESSTIFSSGFSEYYVYYNGLLPVYKTLYPIEPFFEYTRVVKYNWKRPEARLVKVGKRRSNNIPLILVHGIDPNEIYGEWTSYKKLFVESWDKILPNDYELYIFLYPTLDVPLEESAKFFVNEVLSIGRKVNIYTHSMGGILLRYALQEEDLRKQINKIIFAGTPHLGSPLADLVFMNKKILSFHHRYHIIKQSILVANQIGAFIHAKNYNYLRTNFINPDIPNDCNFRNFAALMLEDEENLENFLRKSFRIFENEFLLSVSNIGLLSMNVILRTIYPSNFDYLKNDGLVPISSATYYGESRIFEGYHHFDLAINKDIIQEALEYFYGIE